MRKRFTEILRLASAAIFICLYIVLNRFVSFYIPLGGFPSVRVGVSSIPVLLCSLACGPFWGLVCGAGGDLISAFAFPNGTGGYLYGYTIDAALLGVLPWIISALFKSRKKLYLVLDAVVTVGTFAAFSALLFTYADAGHRIPLNGAGKIGLCLGLFALLLISNGATAIMYGRIENSEENSESGLVRNYYLKLKKLSLNDKDIRRKMRETGKSLMRMSVTVSYDYGIQNLALAPREGRKLWLRSFFLKSLEVSKAEKPKRNRYSFLELFSILLVEGLLIKTFLLAFWGQLYFSIPYAYGVFSDLLTNIVSLPILSLLSWLCCSVLSEIGYFEKLSYRKKTYGQ